MNAIYEESFKVCTWDVDKSDKLTMAAAFNYCQEVAGNHARQLGIGTEYMKDNGIVWILSRMTAVLDRRPCWGSRITAKTWPRGTDRLFARRDYELSDEEGVWGRGRSGWLIVDFATMRPKRPELLVDALPKNDGLDALPEGAAGIDPVTELQPAGIRTAVYSDIDYNGHANNARYVQWIQDTMDVDTLAGADNLRLDINYLAEVRQGSSIEIFINKNVEEGLYHFEGRHCDGGQSSFRARLSIPPVQ